MIDPRASRLSSRSGPWWPYLRTLWVALVLASICGVYVRTFLVQIFRVPSESMQPTLQVGDHILVNKFIFGDLRAGSTAPPAWLPGRQPRRGDVVVLTSPEHRQYLVKRIIGLPGDTLRMSRGRLRINREDVEEPYLATRTLENGEIDDTSVPLDRYFFLGDHRSLSIDSRTWGSLAAPHLVGQAFLICWSDSVSEGEDPDRVVASRGWWSWFLRYRWERFMKSVR